MPQCLVNFCPPFWCIAVNDTFLHSWEIMLYIPDWGKGISIDKSKLLAAAVAHFYIIRNFVA